MGLADLVRGGRAVIYPVYYGTYERGSAAPARPCMCEQFNDLHRTVEYLETRPDIDAERLAFMGVSWGASMGAYLSSDMPRHPTGGRELNPFKALVLIAGGLLGFPTPPEGSQATFATRVKTPVLMINGRYDSRLLLETQVEPLFELFGTPPKDKRLALVDGGHWGWSLSFLLKETLDWLDRYLGPVTKTAPVGGVPSGAS